MKEQITNYEQKSRHCVLNLIQNFPQSPANNTSPNPSKGGEQAMIIFVRKQLPLFWRGLGGGASGLLRLLRFRSVTAARNDGHPTPTLPKGEGEVLLLWRSRRGDSGLPRSSFLTARNDENNVQRHCGLDPQSPTNLQGIPASAGMTRWGNGMTALIGIILSGLERQKHYKLKKNVNYKLYK